MGVQNDNDRSLEMSSEEATEGLKDRKRQLLTISKGKPSGPILRTASRELKYRDQHGS